MTFDEWALNYGLSQEPNYSEPTRKDCEAAFLAGQASAEARVKEKITLLQLMTIERDNFREGCIQASMRAGQLASTLDCVQTELNELKAQADEPVKFTEALFEEIQDEAGRSFRRHCGSVRGQQLSVWDTIDAHLVAAALKRTHPTTEKAQAGEPDLYQTRMRADWQTHWSEWCDCTKGQAEDRLKTPFLHDWHYEVRKLFTHPTTEPVKAQAGEPYAYWDAAHPILPCPFCGKQPHIVDLAGWEVLCKCGLNFVLESSEREPLIAAWNTRITERRVPSDEAISQIAASHWSDGLFDEIGFARDLLNAAPTPTKKGE